MSREWRSHKGGLRRESQARGLWVSNELAHSHASNKREVEGSTTDSALRRAPEQIGPRLRTRVDPIHRPRTMGWQ